jgi:putative membrane-bound dehydrogenase-like protein
MRGCAPLRSRPAPRSGLVSYTLLCALLFCASALPAAQFKFPNQTFTLPDGFEIELVAGPPLVQRPISGSFDDQGRLYVTDSSGSNDKPDQQLREKPHRVVRLEEPDGDGHFKKGTVFADKMMFPEGCLWFNGSLYVAAPPSIWKLTDTNNDGIVDVREEWHQGKTLTGCANDLHGPYLGPDGWLYWCKGAFAAQTYERPGKSPMVSRAAHIFRARPDHSGLEPVLTGGMDNPVGVAFTAEGERILCGTFFAPDEPGHRDGLIHAIYGGVYGKVNDVTDAHKKTGDLMPVMTHMGPAAPCSVIRYESRVFGEDYRNNLFVCAFNLHKVSRHILEPDGATFKTKDGDFLTSDNPDFHPTDVIEDADGSLLVLDTGGWYKLCCPTSQLSKPDVLGAIYRIRRAGAPKMADARGLKIPWGKLNPTDLAGLLGDERPMVKKRAIGALGKQGQAAIPALRQIVLSGRDTRDFKPKAATNKGEWFKENHDWRERKIAHLPYKTNVRQNAIWALTRIDLPEARMAVREGVDDFEESVRLAAYHSISLYRDVQGGKKVQQGLNELIRSREWRSILELFGRTGTFTEHAATGLLLYFDDNVMPLEKDRALRHSLSYALIESEAREAARFLARDGYAFESAALIALDQMDNGGLDVQAVLPPLKSADKEMRRTALWIASHHPEWGEALAGFFRERLASKDLSVVDREELTQQLTVFARNNSTQEIMAAVLEEQGTSSEVRRIVLHAMAQANLKGLPASWTEAVRSCLTNQNEAVLRSAVGTARALPQAKTNAANFSTELMRIARDESRPAELRLEALAALPGGLREVGPELFGFLCVSVGPGKPVMRRGAAAGVLAKATLNEEQLLALTEIIKQAGPLEMTQLLTAFESATNETVGLKLVAALKGSKGLASLRPDLLKALVAKYPTSVQQQGGQLMTLLNMDTEKQRAHLDDLLTQLKDGDIRRGQNIFNSPKAACASCHTLGYLGGNVGPDLTSIGTVRTERDLLESIVYPSASFVRSYEPYLVTTRAEESYNGVLKKDAPDEVVLATGPGTEVRLARSEITDMRPGTVSIMPAGLDQQLSKQELADLVAFLKATKWGPR